MFITDLILIWIFSPLGWFWWKPDIFDFARGDLIQIQSTMAEVFLFIHACIITPFILYVTLDTEIGWLVITLIVYFGWNILLTAVSYVSYYRRGTAYVATDENPWRRPRRAFQSL